MSDSKLKPQISTEPVLTGASGPCSRPRTQLSIIIPTLNEGQEIATCLGALQSFRGRGHQVILVDGGSVDDTAGAARGLVDRLLVSAPGRAAQMNRGARAATGNTLLFLHADTRLPETADALVESALAGSEGWGRFDIRLTGSSMAFRIIEFCMNLRSRVTRVATGDQAIFVSRSLFDRTGGWAHQPLMEDIEFSSRLRREFPPHCLRARVITSSRRWERNGIARTVLKMWKLRLCYALGADAARLVRDYD